MPMYGADSDALDALAQRLDGWTVMLRDAESLLTRQLGSSPWEGQRATAFRSEWSRRHRRELGSVAQGLRSARDALARNAREQRAASRAESGLGDFFMRKFGAAAAAAQATAASKALAAGYLDDLRRLQNATPAEQAAWWAALSPAAQAALLLHMSGRLTGLAGLPPEVLEQARRNYIEQRKGDIVVSSTTEKVAGSVDVAWVEIGAEASAEITEYADGRAEVSLTLRGELGAKVGDGAEGAKAQGGVSAGAEVTMNYSFASREEAERFLEGLKREMIPNKGELAKALVPFAGAGLVAADAAMDVKRYLDANASKYQSTTFKGDISGKVEFKAGPVDIELKGGAYASYNTVSGTNIGLELSGNAAADLGITSGGASASIGLDVHVDKDGNLGSLTIKGEMSASGSVDLGKFFGTTGSGLGDQVTAGASMSFEAKVDLSDPYIQEQAGHLIKAAAAGDPAATKAILALVREADVTVSVDATATEKSEFDAGVGKVSYERSTTSNVVTYMKPPGGGWTTYRQGAQ